MKPETQEWLRIAEGDIGSAGSLLRDGFVHNSAYFCQQAVEKLLKGMVTEMGSEPPKTHDLLELAELAGIDLTPEDRIFLTRLADHAIRGRYPGAEYNEQEVGELYEEAKRFWEWLRAKLR